jgi:DNA-directed RNA polymerase subunit RPC12/RpoP
MADEQARSEADRLYWDTGTPVADIADRLEISRRALYDAIQPRPIGLACADCGEGLVFRNRSAAERRQAECPACGNEVVVEPIPEGEDAAEPQVEQERTAARMAPLDRKRVPAPAHGAGLSAALVAGLALGAVAGYLLRTR